MFLILLQRNHYHHQISVFFFKTDPVVVFKILQSHLLYFESKPEARVKVCTNVNMRVSMRVLWWNAQEAVPIGWFKHARCSSFASSFQLQKTFALPVFRRESCWLVTYLEWVLLGVLTKKEDNGKRNRKGLKSSSVCLSLRQLFFIA